MKPNKKDPLKLQCLLAVHYLAADSQLYSVYQNLALSFGIVLLSSTGFNNLNLIVCVNLFYFVCVHIIYFEGLMED